MNEYIRNGNTVDIKDILKIRLHIWDVKKNYPKKIAEKKIQDSMCSLGKWNLRKKNTLLEVVT